MRPWSNLFNLPIDKIAGRVYNGNFERQGRGRSAEYTINGDVCQQIKQTKKISQVWEIFHLLTLDSDAEDGTQDCDNEPNHQYQFPRKRDNERADGHDADGGEKPAEKPDQSSREQEVDAKAYQHQKQSSKHFLFSSFKYDSFVCGEGRSANKRVICEVIGDK